MSKVFRTEHLDAKRAEKVEAHDSPRSKAYGEDQEALALVTVALGIVAILGFIPASLPQTYADATVSYIPYLSSLVHTGSFPHHQYDFSRLSFFPVMLILAPAYLFLGENGSSWTVWACFVGLMNLVYHLCLRVTGDRLISALTSFSFVTIPLVWLHSATTYVEIPIATLFMSGIYWLWKSVEQKNLAVAAVAAWSIGFSASTKLHSVLLWGIVLTIFIAKNRYFLIEQVRTYKAKLTLIAALGIFAFIPWQIYILHRTGNPFFPYLNSIFPSKFSNVAVFTREAEQLFGPKYGIFSILRLPWDLTFNTSFFGEYLDGTFGFWTLMFIPFCLFFFRRNANGRIWIRPIVYDSILPLIVFILSVWGFTHILYFRYWIPAVALSAIGVSTAMSCAHKNYSFLKNRYLVLCITFIYCLILTGYLASYGARLNYKIPWGIGWDEYRDNKKLEQLNESHRQGVDRFINERLRPNEAVLATGFSLCNTLVNGCVYLSDDRSFFGKAASLAGFEAILQELNIRFWIVDTRFSTEVFFKSGISAKYLVPKRIVFSSEWFRIYAINF